MYKVPSGSVSAWLEKVLTTGWVPYDEFRREWRNITAFRDALDFEERALDVMWQVDRGLLRPKPLARDHQEDEHGF
jgi:hypothetical protein